MKPTFYIIGAPKCGTTSWAAYLAEHPMVRFSEPKELNYFSTDLKTRHNVIVESDAEYESKFQRPDSVPQAGEATPLYLYSSRAVEKIASYTPDAKVVILLREPVSFVRSLHQQFLYRRIETEQDPRKAWELSGKRNMPDNPDGEAWAKHLDYKGIGDFPSQVDRVLNHFPPEQIFIAWMEDWKHDPNWLYQELAKFLQIDGSHPLTFEVHNSAKRHRSALIAKLTIRPPSGALAIAGWVKNALGLKRLGVVKRLRKLNTSYDVAKAFAPDLAQEISEFYQTGYDDMNQRCTDLGILRRHPAQL